MQLRDDLPREFISKTLGALAEATMELRALNHRRYSTTDRKNRGGDRGETAGSAGDKSLELARGAVGRMLADLFGSRRMSRKEEQAQ
jgi:hypothetical protein